MTKHRVIVFKSLIFSIILVIGFTNIYADIGQSNTLTEKSYLQARRVLDRGIEALGGLAELTKIVDITIKFNGQSFARHQSVSPEAPYDALPLEGRLILALPRKLALFEQTSNFPGGFSFRFRTLVRGDKGFLLNLTEKTVTPRDPGFINTVAFSRLPHATLLTALERAATLRWLGEEDYEGKRHNVIAFAGSDNVQYTLYFNAETNLLTKYELLYTDPVAGDAIQEVIFSQYRSAGTVKIPIRRIQKRAGEVIDDLAYTEVQLNTSPSDNIFATPSDYKERPMASYPTTVKEIAQGVFTVGGVGGDNYNILFVAFKDYILVIEAPLSSNAAEAAIAKIKETLPGKPIKYIVPTHHHNDHSGGMRAFIAEGATIVTTAGNRRHFERMAAAVRTIAPDALTRNPHPVLIEPIEGKKRIFTDGSHTVEILNIGPSPHANELLIAYLPQEKILFQGDLLSVESDLDMQPANDTTVHFAEQIQRQGLQIEKIIGVHGSIGTMQDLQTSLERRRVAKRNQ
ncbi:MAG: MBL fold metallo-hydrolase [Acidobacteriota bacterium]